MIPVLHQANTYREMPLRLEKPVQLTQQEFDEFWPLYDMSARYRYNHRDAHAENPISVLAMRARLLGTTGQLCSRALR